MNLNWMQDERWYPDALHFLGAYCVVMSGAFLAPEHTYTFMVAMLGYGLIKEFVVDKLFEKNPPQYFADNLRDFCGYAGGVVAAGLVILLA